MWEEGVFRPHCITLLVGNQAAQRDAQLQLIRAEEKKKEKERRRRITCQLVCLNTCVVVVCQIVVVASSMMAVHGGISFSLLKELPHYFFRGDKASCVGNHPGIIQRCISTHIYDNNISDHTHIFHLLQHVDSNIKTMSNAKENMLDHVITELENVAQSEPEK